MIVEDFFKNIFFITLYFKEAERSLFALLAIFTKNYFILSPIFIKRNPGLSLDLEVRRASPKFKIYLEQNILSPTVAVKAFLYLLEKK